MSRYYLKPAPFGSNSYHVMEAGRLNRFGESYCVAPYLTAEQAEAMVRKHNTKQCGMKEITRVRWNGYTFVIETVRVHVVETSGAGAFR